LLEFDFEAGYYQSRIASKFHRQLLQIESQIFLALQLASDADRLPNTGWNHASRHNVGIS
jgi:hypothetical protein